MARVQLMRNDLRFSGLWTRLIATDVTVAWSQLDACYGDSARSYHNWTHIEAMLGGFDAARAAPEFAAARHDEVELAIFFHDAVYQPGEADNEERSAGLFLTLAGARPRIGQPAIARVVEMIRATARHLTTPDISTRMLLDLDLAILGSTPANYRSYVAAVRREYVAVPEPAWRTGRAAVMIRFLERERLYQSEYASARLEAQARANIAAEIATLRR